MRRDTTVGTAGTLALLLTCAPTAAQQEHTLEPVTDEMLAAPDDADWLMWRRTLDGWGYSPLAGIDRTNVDELELAWSAPVGAGTQEGTPLAYDGMLYVPSSGDYIQAFDAATGELIWEYRRELPEDVRPATDRNIAIWGSTIINAGSDNQIYALDALTGELVWETPVLEPTARAQTTAGPIIANGRVITGRQCQPEATHAACIVAAHDAESGRELWRTRTIPRPGEPGDETWGDVPLEERWHVGTWMVPSYDPELDIIYVGTSVTIPAPKFTLGGPELEHLYHNSTLALDGDTGEIVWYHQHHIDHWDLDHVFERLLVDTAVAPDPDEVAWINPDLEPGEQRRVVTGIPGKTGSSIRSIARRASFSGRGRRSCRTSSNRSTARRARRSSTPKSSTRKPASRHSSARPRAEARTGPRAPTARAPRSCTFRCRTRAWKRPCSQASATRASSTASSASR